MPYRTADFVCTNEECGFPDIILYDRDEGPGEQTCPHCSSPMRECFPAPTVMRHGFVDGQERGERWTMLKQSAKLEQDASRLRKNGKKEEAREMMAESKKLGTRAAEKRDKTDT